MAMHGHSNLHTRCQSSRMHGHSNLHSHLPIVMHAWPLLPPYPFTNPSFSPFPSFPCKQCIMHMATQVMFNFSPPLYPSSRAHFSLSPFFHSFQTHKTLSSCYPSSFVPSITTRRPRRCCSSYAWDRYLMVSFRKWTRQQWICCTSCPLRDMRISYFKECLGIDLQAEVHIRYNEVSVKIFT